MQALAVSYFKRYKMEVGLANLPPPHLPEGCRAVAWRPDLVPVHADVLCRSFQGEIDAVVFPSLGTFDGCLALMNELVRRRAFIPEATWLVEGPLGPCGSVQALRERGAFGAIQNLGVLPACRGRRIGEALLLLALHGMARTGPGRAVLEVTADNGAAHRLYRRLGFQRTRVVYKAVRALSSSMHDQDGSVPIF